ncbi:hypothetical protein GGF43_000951 [Coemansia sp. RSA 2618]|nr:hypothetical protein GGF43_000951 [Coemansia sp. RSA 2618]
MAKPKLKARRLMVARSKAKGAMKNKEAMKEKEAAKAKPDPANLPAKKKPRTPFFPYKPTNTILLIGEGNFSFALSVATKLESGANIVATAYDSEKVAREKYDDIQANIDGFTKLGGTVIFDVDGTNISGCKEVRGKKFSHIVFNFPHVGAGIKDQSRNIQTNQKLLLDFFTSAREFLVAGAAKPKVAAQKARKPRDGDDDSDSDDGEAARNTKKRRTRSKDGKPIVDVMEFGGVQAQVVYDATEEKYEPADEDEAAEPGTIHVALKSGKPYDHWNIKQLARTCSLYPGPTRPFDVDAYPGYAHRRTLGFKDGVSKDGNKEISDKNPKLYSFISNSGQDGKQAGTAPNGKGRKTKAQHAMGVNSESFDGTKQGKKRLRKN